MALKVFGWQGCRAECPGHHRQTREICAAKSMAEVARLAGVKRSGQLFNLCESGNPDELAQAFAKPGVVLWRPIDDYRGKFTEASQASPKVLA